MPDIYKKQYILSSRILELPHMNVYSVGKAYLYVHPLLPVLNGFSGTGKTVIVLGHAYCADEENKTVAQDIAAWDGADFALLTRYWTGRFVVITESGLVTDACGLMSAFYKIDDFGWIISSSLAVMAMQYGLPQGEPCGESGLQWQILPKTRAEGVRKLLCTQMLFFSGNTMEIVPFIWIENNSAASTDEKVSELCKLLTTVCCNIAKAASEGIVLALTGGKDSRLVLAALLASKVPFVAYTSAYPNISQSDKKLPKVMCRDLGISHTYIRKRKFDKCKAEMYCRFTFGDTNGLDGQFYACGQFEEIPPNSIVIRSGIFEAAQSYGRTIAGNTAESFSQGFRRYYAQSLQSKEQADAFAQWLQWVEENPVSYIDIRDRFYIEQRVGGWAAAIEHSLDLNNFTAIQIANCPRVISILLSASDEERKQLALAIGSVQKMQGNLLGYPINKRTLWDKVRYVLAVLRNPIKKFKNYYNKQRRK